MNKTQKLAGSLLLFLVVTGSTLGAEPVIVASGQGPTAPKQPQVAVGKNGVVHLIYGMGDTVFHCLSTNRGTSFDTPKAAFRVPNLSLGMRRGPRLAVTNDALIVSAIGGPQGKGRDGDLQAWRSKDGGTTWQGPATVNAVTGSAREGLHGMAAGADDSVWCVWLDLREKRTEVYASKSVDGGESWGTNVLVYRSPDGSVCECCHPSVTVSKDAVNVMFRNSLAGNRDMYVAKSKDGGESFAAAKKLGQSSWKLNACPMDGGMLATSSKSSIISVWRRNGEVFTATAEGKEQSLGRGEQPWVASAKNASVIVWTTGREGDLLTQIAGSKQPKQIGVAARDPMVASSLDGEGPVVACWESKQEGQSVVVASRIDLPKSKLP